jgi:formylglycine-generating enzyme required for sulfatase activity
MHGNVEEWCEEPWHDSYVGGPADGSPRISGVDQNLGVVRGGSWNGTEGGCWSGTRKSVAPALARGFIGCRVVLRVGDAPAVVAAPPPAASEQARLQADAAKARGVPVEKSIEVGSGVKMGFVLIPAGSFRMGSETEGPRERPVHLVTLAKPLYMGMYEVTQEQWEAVMGADPSHFRGLKNPVESVSWNACQDLVRKLTKTTGRKFSLPSEAEWEYACRAGTTTRFSFGDEEAGLVEYAWYFGNSGGTTHPVGQKKPNAWGLYDMHGNVAEWCEDAWHESYVGAPVDGSPWVAGGEGLRVLRGGSWAFRPSLCRSAGRFRFDPSTEVFLGCRVVLRDF